MADQDRFCAICERKLVEKDSEHVCRSCFRKAREPKETAIHISDEGAERLDIAMVERRMMRSTRRSVKR